MQEPHENKALEELERFNRRRRRQTDYGPILGVLIVAVVGILGASYAFNKKEAAEQGDEPGEVGGTTNVGRDVPFGGRNQATGDDLFLDLEPEVGPSLVDRAPAQLDHARIFQSAMRRAHEGLDLADRAGAARDAGDDAEYERLGRLAFGELDAAFRSVEDWELRIRSDYSTKDGQVRAIMKEITSWKKARDQFIKLPGIVDGPGSADTDG
jgi:hypothetical protein